MTINGALSNAMSGLRAAGRGAEVISNNISNALTPGYARRGLELATTQGAGGVRITGISRHANPALVADRRLAGSDQEQARMAVDFFSTLETALGLPGNPASLAALMSGFENALVSAASRPDAPERLDASVATARDLANQINRVSGEIQSARTEADRSIADQVQRVNASLQSVEMLNGQIARVAAGRGDVSSLLDQRQQVIDTISGIIPVREMRRSDHEIALYTLGGTALLDGSAAELSFDPVNLVTPYMTHAGGMLSGLSIDGKPVRTDSERGVIGDGTLAAQFAIRDEDGVAAQAELDAFARDLITRFQSPGTDPSLAPGDPGLFTDGGAAFDPAQEVGIAERLSVNAAVDPEQGGESRRMRDGLNTAAAGDVGSATLLHSMTAALRADRVPASGSFTAGALSSFDFLTNLSAQAGSNRGRADQALAFASSRLTELTERELSEGVNTDDELQRLMLVEQAYAANARVIETVDEMMQTIMRI